MRRCAMTVVLDDAGELVLMMRRHLLLSLRQPVEGVTGASLSRAAAPNLPVMTPQA
jgi:hypothetical protein